LSAKELTDEEIDKVWAETCSDFKLIENGKTKGIINIYDVSRAILKKAREK
jgi:carbonic anhydrase